MSDAQSTTRAVPASITFGYKVLRVPTLLELGIPMAGFMACSLNERLRGHGYETCWIERGDSLLKYEFRCFLNETKPVLAAFRGDPFWRQESEIVSPISGLLLSTRPEQTLGFNPGSSLQYECCEEQRLPVILVPNDEPLPDPGIFYVYDRIACLLRDNFDRIPIRDRSSTSPERLREYITRHGKKTADIYQADLNALQRRRPEDHRTFDIREVCSSDVDLIGRIQNLRTKDIALREKLVHISRKYAETI